MTDLQSQLSGLPKPAIIETLSYEEIRQRSIDRLVSLDPEGFDAILESDPVIKLIEVDAYNEFVLRQRVNDAVRANLLAFAAGSDLDHLAAFYGVIRMVGELDDRLRLRVILAIEGRSTGGTEPRYKFIAMSSDIRVSNVAVYTVGRDPTIRVAVFSNDNGGVADAILLGKVDAALQDINVRMVNDTIVVAAAATNTYNISVQAWLLPTASNDTAALMEASLRTAFAAEMQLGRDITIAWIIGKLMIAGVQNVTVILPTATIVVPPNQAAALGTVTILVKGRDF
jgi:phage-related baseplate assembly protein